MEKLIIYVLTVGSTLPILKTVESQDQLWITEKNGVWKVDTNICGVNGSFAGESVENLKTLLRDIKLTVPIWVNGYAVLSPWYGYVGCVSFNNDTGLEKAALKRPDVTPSECIKHCRNNKDIGIKDTNCYCINSNNKNLATADEKHCKKDNISTSIVLKVYRLFYNYNKGTNHEINDQYNRSCLSTIYSEYSRYVKVSNCEERHKYICSKGSKSNYTTSHTEADGECRMKTTTLDLEINSDTSDDILWIGFIRDEEIIWGKELPENDEVTYKCLAVVKNDTKIVFSFHYCNESMQYLCNANTTFDIKDQTQSEQGISVSTVTVNVTESMEIECTELNLSILVGSCVAVAVAIVLVVVGVFIVGKRCRHLNTWTKRNHHASENKSLNKQNQSDRIENRISTPEYHYLSPETLHADVNDSHLYDHSFVDHDNNDYDVTTTQLKKQELRADDTYDHTPRSRAPTEGAQKGITDTYDHV